MVSWWPLSLPLGDSESVKPFPNEARQGLVTSTPHRVLDCVPFQCPPWLPPTRIFPASSQNSQVEGQKLSFSSLGVTLSRCHLLGVLHVWVSPVAWGPFSCCSVLQSGRWRVCLRQSSGGRDRWLGSPCAPSPCSQICSCGESGRGTIQSSWVAHTRP